MKNLTDEIKLTIELMQGDIDDGAHGELQSHLYSLLEMKRGLLSERVHTYTPAQIQIWPTDADDRIDGEHYGWTPEAVKDECKEYTLQEVIGDAFLGDWVRWVVVTKCGVVVFASHRPKLYIDSDQWDFIGRHGVFNKVVPPISFKNCIWEVKG